MPPVKKQKKKLNSTKSPSKKTARRLAPTLYILNRKMQFSNERHDEALNLPRNWYHIDFCHTYANVYSQKIDNDLFWVANIGDFHAESLFTTPEAAADTINKMLKGVINFLIIEELEK